MSPPLDNQLSDWRSHALKLENEVKKVIVGQDKAIRLMNIAIFARGHVLLEGGVGVGKTTLLRSPVVSAARMSVSRARST